MASTIKLKRSSIAGKVPTTSDVATAELALNLKDARLYSANSSAVFEIGANPHSLSVGSGSFSIANGAITFPTADGSANQVLTTNGSGQLVFAADAQRNLQSIDGHVIPASNTTYDLGSSTKAWRSLYLSGDTIFMDNTKIQTTAAGDVRIADSANNTVSLTANAVSVSALNFSGVSAANNAVATITADGALAFTEPAAFSATAIKALMKNLTNNDSVMTGYTSGSAVTEVIRTLDQNDYVVTDFSAGNIVSRVQVKNLTANTTVVTSLSTSVSVDKLKEISAAASNFADFQSRIAAL